MSYKIVHWEIMGPDGAGQKDFYSNVFDWGLDEVPGFNNYYVTTEEATGWAGAVGQGSDDMSSYVTMYVEVPDIDAHLAKIGAAGGQTITPRTVIPGTVVFALFTDPAGNVMGIVEPGTPE